MSSCRYCGHRLDGMNESGYCGGCSTLAEKENKRYESVYGQIAELQSENDKLKAELEDERWIPVGEGMPIKDVDCNKFLMLDSYNQIVHNYFWSGEKQKFISSPYYHDKESWEPRWSHRWNNVEQCQMTHYMILTLPERG